MIDQSRLKYLKKKIEDERPDLTEKTVTPNENLNFKERAENMKRLLRYRAMWDNMADFRRRRQRNKDYATGKQWNDLVDMGNGKFITEAQNIIEQGKVPLKNNVIGHLVNSVLGTFRDIYNLPEVTARVRENQTIGEMNTNMLEYIYQINETKELDAKDALEFMYGGLVCQTIDYQWDTLTRRNEEKMVSWNPTRVILPGDLQDPRGRDIKCIGVIMDMSLDEVVQKFAREEKDEYMIREIYKHFKKERIFDAYHKFGTDLYTKNMDFFCPNRDDVCRVYQMWELESEKCWLVTDHMEGRRYIYPYSDKKALEAMIKERQADILAMGLDEKKAGIEMEYYNDIFWYVRYLTPYGDVLYQGKTPFAHNDHPFSLCIGHLIDGEIHSYVENIIDQQRYINRLITLSDFIISSSAKGVLVFPENAIPKGMNKEDILEQWTSYRGVIFANLKPGTQMPAQIASNCTNIGINEMLSMQLSLIRDIAGVHGAMQGKDAKSGQSATLYQQEALNAQTNIRDMLDTFIAFRRRRDYKAIMVAPQCYDEEFYMAVSGDHEDAQVWNPLIASSAPLYVQISETNNAVAYRSMMNEFLLKAMEMRMTDLETVLKGGSFPYADKILRVIEEQKQKAMQEQAQMQAQQMQGQAMGMQMQEQGATPGEVMQAAADAASGQDMQALEEQAQQADPEALALLQQALA